MRRSRLIAVLTFALLVGALLGSRLDVRLRPPPEADGKESAKGLSDQFVEVTQRVMPSVVCIDATKIVPGHAVVDPFFFPMLPQQRFFTPPEQHTSVGSGLVVRPDGYIVTNHHVVAGVQQIRVTFADGRVAPARLIGSDAASDVAVLKVGMAKLPTVPWGDSQKLRLGEWVLAFGSPFRMQGSVCHGIVSAKGRRDLGISDYENFIQTDAPINHGNSGGPLVNLAGQVVGINSAILSRNGAANGISLAIPSEIVRSVMEELIATGKVNRSWLGFMVQTVDDYISQQLGLPQATGVLVQAGYRDGPAGKAGFQSGDVIIEANGLKIVSEQQLRSFLAQTPVGHPITFGVWRQGQVLQLTAITSTRAVDAAGQPAQGI